ncbi:MAG: STAS domain-containing protein [Actinomycetota bacterium]
MLKITPIEAPVEAVTLRLEGRVIGAWVEELRQSCTRVLAQPVRLILDLTDVSFIDTDGLALVRSLADRQVTIVNCSPFVTEQLRGGGPCSPHSWPKTEPCGSTRS